MYLSYRVNLNSTLGFCSGLKQMYVFSHQIRVNTRKKSLFVSLFLSKCIVKSERLDLLLRFEGIRS